MTEVTLIKERGHKKKKIKNKKRRQSMKNTRNPVGEALTGSSEI